jgi:hypothetical protein
MGLRFRRSVRLIPGIRVNFSKSGTSVSFGFKGMTHNIGPRGSRTTFSAPGTGLSQVDYHRRKRLAGQHNGPDVWGTLWSTMIWGTLLIGLSWKVLGIAWTLAWAIGLPLTGFAIVKGLRAWDRYSLDREGGERAKAAWLERQRQEEAARAREEAVQVAAAAKANARPLRKEARRRELEPIQVDAAARRAIKRKAE